MSLRDIAIVFVSAILALVAAGCDSGSSGGGSASSGVGAGQVALEVSGLPASVSAGQAATFAVIARLPTGEVATTYRGTVSFASDDPQATVPAPYTFQASDSGSHFFTSGLTLRSAGARRLTVVDAAFPQVTGARTVAVTAGAAASLALSLAASEPSGRTFSAGALSVVDAFGNPVAFDAAADPVTLTASPAGAAITGLGAAGLATLDRTADFVTGTATLAGRLTVTGPEGTYTLSARSASGLVSNTPALVLFRQPLPIVTLEVQGFTSSLGAGDSTSIAVLARDSSGTIATNYVGTVTFTADDALATVPTAFTFTSVDSGVHVFPNGVTFRAAGDRTIRVTDAANGLTGARTLTVTAGPLDRFVFVLPPAQSVNAPFSGGTITAVDQFGNAVRSFNAAADPVTITVAPSGAVDGLGGAGDTLGVAGDFVQGVASLGGRMVFSGLPEPVAVFTARSLSGRSGSSGTVNMRGVLLTISVSGLPTSTQAGTANQVLVAVRDNQGQLATSYIGTVTFTANDAQASLPATYTFTPQDTGVHLFPGVVLRSAGARTVTVRDVNDASVFGTATAQILAGPIVGFQVALPPEQRVGVAFTTGTARAVDTFGNTVASFNAGIDPVTISVSPADGTVSGLSGAGNALDQPGDFNQGVATLGGFMVFEGPEGNHSFTARSAAGLAGTSTAVFLENPAVAGLAEYRDEDFDGTCNAGDTLVIPFGTEISVTAAQQTDLRLLVSGDSFGSGASVAKVSGQNAVRVTLGTGAHLKSRFDFAAGQLGLGAPSGIDVFPGQTAIRAVRDGSPIQPSSPIDIFPSFVGTADGSTGGSSLGCVLVDEQVDGDLDVITISGSELLRRHRRVGSSYTTTSGAYFLSNGSYDAQAIAAGDLNKDGYADFAVAAKGESAVFLMSPSGGSAGTYPVVPSLLLPNGTINATLTASVDGRTIAFGDMDEDGDVDIVIGYGVSQGVHVFANNGAAIPTFDGGGAPFASLATGDVRAVALGDVTGDGHLDIVAGALDQPIRIFTSDFGNFSFNEVLPVSTAGTLGLSLADLDGDGALDIVEARADGVRVHQGSGTGSFATIQSGLAPGAGMVMALADADGDGDRDVMLGYGAAVQGTILLYEPGQGFRSSGLALGSAATGGFAAGDLDNDGDLDFFRTSSTGDRAVCSSLSGTRGDLRFSGPVQSLAIANIIEGLLADLDGDGDLDLTVVSDGSGNQLRFYRNDGAGSLSFAASGGTSVSFCRGVASGDLDNDGDLDIAVSEFGGGTVRLFENRGNFNFVQYTSLPVFSLNALSGFPSAVGIIDVDLDGLSDVVIVSEGTGSGGVDGKGGIYVYRGTGLGNMSTSPVFAFEKLNASYSFRPALVARILGGDSPKHRTLVVYGDSSGGGADLLRIGTDFTEQNAGTTVGSFVHSGYALGDWNRNGSLDLALAARGGSGVQTSLNTSSELGGARFNSFGGATTLPSVTAQDHEALGSADFDGDGDLDLVCSSGLRSEARFFVNNGAGVFTDSLVALSTGAGGTFQRASVLTGDLDGDGDVDVVVLRAGASGGFRVLRNDQ